MRASECTPWPESLPLEAEPRNASRHGSSARLSRPRLVSFAARATLEAPGDEHDPPTRGHRVWSTYRDRHATADEVAAWAEDEPEHNIGILCGETSCGLAAVDLDAEFPAGVKISSHRDCPHRPRASVLRGRREPDVNDALRVGRTPRRWLLLRRPGERSPERPSLRVESTPEEGIAALEEFELPLASRAKPCLPLKGR